MRCLNSFTSLFICVAFLVNSVHGQSSYGINHKSSARYFTSRKYINTRDGGTVITGKWGFQEDGAQVFIMKLDKTGRAKWSKKIDYTRETYEFFVVELADGSIVFAGNSQNNSSPVYSDITLVRFTCEGDILWSKNVSVPSTLGNRFLLPYSLKAGKNNDFLLTYYGHNATSQFLVISRIDDTGTAVWSKTFMGNDAQTAVPAVAFTSGNNVVAIGMNSYYTNYYNYYKSFFALTLNYADGAVLQMKGYDYSEHITNSGVLVSHQSNHFYVEQLASGGFAVFGEFSNFDPSTHYFFKLNLNQDLSIGHSISYAVPVNLGKQWAKMRVLPNGEAHIFSLTPTYQQLCWFAADAGSNTIRQKVIDYSGANTDLWYAPAANGNNAMNFVVSRLFLPESSIEVTQLVNQSNDINECIGADTSYVQLVPWTASEGTVIWQSVNDGGAVITTLQLTSSDIPITSTYVCDPGVPSDPVAEKSFRIVGDSSACGAGDPVQFTGRMLNGSGKVNWLMDSSFYDSFEQLNDSTVSVVLKKQETIISTKIFAFTASCETLSDSIEITFYPSPDSTTKVYNSCEFPLALTAGGGYKSYKWQDGSGSPVFQATGAGSYVVELQTYCGNVHTETIQVESGECSNTLYLPNAFTPDGDGINDKFKPAVSGVFDYYEFTIYNRWGQQVFRTLNSQDGWDGTFRGSRLKSDVFVCIIRYRFPGEGMKILRGLATLVR